MVIFYETKNFIIEAMDKPHIDRNDGGHIRIQPKVRVVNRQELSPKFAIELMRLTTLVGEAMTKVMNEHGVNIGRINYQDNGNWGVYSKEGPHLHIHLYGRAKSAKMQKYGHSLVLPLREEDQEYYAKCKPLNKSDIKDIKKEILRLFKTNKYKDSVWRL